DETSDDGVVRRRLRNGVQIFFPEMRLPQPRVRRAACGGLQRRIGLIDADDLARRADDSSRFHGHVADAAANVQNAHARRKTRLQENIPSKLGIELTLPLQTGKLAIAVSQRISNGAVRQMQTCSEGTNTAN